MIRFIFSLAIVLLTATSIFSQAWKDRQNWPADFPRPPKTETSLFFLQRNLNVNTIMYDLNLNADGSINTKEPLEVYWKRYTGKRNGVRDEITWLQDNFAFGYSSDKNDNEFDVKLVAYKDRRVKLKKINGNWVATMRINGKECQLSNIYVYADESGLTPDVKHVDLFGKDLATGNTEYERFFND